MELNIPFNLLSALIGLIKSSIRGLISPLSSRLGIKIKNRRSLIKNDPLFFLLNNRKARQDKTDLINCNAGFPLFQRTISRSEMLTISFWKSLQSGNK